MALPCTPQKAISMQHQLNLNLPSSVELIDYKLFTDFEVKVYIKRDDLIHQEVSGNKWRKLKLNLEKFYQGKYESLITFGGAYSNHISAVAAIGGELNIKTIGIIRGEELTANSNATLQRAAAHGMELVFVDRETYSWRYEVDYKNALRERFGNALVIEEGGANFLGVMGCTEIVSEMDFIPDYFILPAGTGTTAAGILMASDTAKVIAVPVFKNGDFIRDEIAELLRYAGLDDDLLAEKLDLLTLATDFDFGGYGKFNAELIGFMNHIYQSTQLKLDQIYTAKMFYALCNWIETGKIKRGSTVVAIHTGGLQGALSIQDKLNYSLL